MTREEAAKILQDSADEVIGNGIEIISRDGGIAVELAIEALKERKTGQWVRLENGSDGCNQCWENDFGWARFSFCPHCGAKMEVDE